MTRRQRLLCTTKVENQPLEGYEPQPSYEEMPPSNGIKDEMPPSNGIKEEVQKGFEEIPNEEMQNEESRHAFDDMVEMFLTQRKCTSVNVCYSLLKEDTRRYLRSLVHQRRLQYVVSLEWPPLISIGIDRGRVLLPS